MIEFDIMESIAKLASVTIAVEHEQHKAVDGAAQVVKAEAKAEIGIYQGAAGPFVQWAELADSTQSERSRLGFTPNDPLLRTGALRDSIGHQTEGLEAVIGSDSEIAVYQELGTSRGIPPRSFLGGAAVRKTPDVVEIMGEGTVIGLIGEDVFRRHLPIRES